MKMYSFNEKLYKKCKKELDKKSDSKYGYEDGFLSCYYSPILIVLKQLFKDFKNKKILEVGYRVPLFLDYLKGEGADVYGIDVDPAVVGDNLIKMSVEKMDKEFMKKHKFDVIFERITLSRLYDENYFLDTGKFRFKNKEKILSNLYVLLKKGGYLILQDDRGSIFTESQFKKIGFKKVMKEIPIIYI